MFSFTSVTKKLLTAVIISAALTVAAAAAEISVGTVQASALNVRATASTAASIVASAPKGDQVIILETSGSWCKVSYKYQEGYMSSEYLTISQSADLSSTGLTGAVTGSVVNLRSAPGTTSNVVCQLKEGSSAGIIGVSGGWYQIQHGSSTGYIHPEYFRIQKQSDSAPASAVSNTAADPTAATDNGLRSQVVDYAKQYIGTKYTSGGRSPSVGFDCSGFVYYVFKNFDFSLNPGASNQMDAVASVSKDNLLPGDLVFFNSGSARRASHVGIYIGNNQFIHAVSHGNPLAISSMSDSYYSRYYVGGGRVLS